MKQEMKMEMSLDLTEKTHAIEALKLAIDVIRDFENITGKRKDFEILQISKALKLLRGEK